MYDTITCKYPLPTPNDPKGYVSSATFQTKDLDLSLNSYIIDENGQLFIERFEGEWSEGNKDSESIIGRMSQHRITKEWLEQLNITATVDFYDYQQSNDTSYDYYIKYEVILINGVANEVKLIDFEATDNAVRKKRAEESLKEREEWQRFSKTRIYKYFVCPYNKSIRFIFRKLSKILSFFSSKIWILERKFLI
jgi:hypothetical protein